MTVFLTLLGRTGKEIHTASCALDPERCLSEAAKIIAIARKGTRAAIRVWDSKTDESLVWKHQAPGRASKAIIQSRWNEL